MPNVWCHIRLAEEFAACLPQPAAEKLLQAEQALFRLAAQGPDIFLYDGWETGYAKSRFRVGKYLHRADCREALLYMLEKARPEQPGAELSFLQVYALGAAAHFIVDATIHPLVYAIVPDIPSEHGKQEHSKLECEMDLFVQQEIYGISAPLLPTGTELQVDAEREDAVAEYYVRLCNEYYGAVPPALAKPLTKAEVRHALRSYFRAMRATHTHGGALKVCRALGKLSRGRLRLDNLWRPKVLPEATKKVLNERDFPRLFAEAKACGCAFFPALWSFWQGEVDINTLRELLPNRSYLGVELGV